MSHVEHTFVICAYKESKYLEECIRSLKSQKLNSYIKLATATPCEYLDEICSRYNIEYCVRNGKPGIADDWNYAYSIADTDYVTITHQDDVYYSQYSKQVVDHICGQENVLVTFTDYSEIKNGKEMIGGLNLYIKRLLLVPIRNNRKNDISWRKRFAIMFGNAIGCPSVTYNKKAINRLLEEEGREQLFLDHFRSNLDWELWEWLSRKKGRFVFIPKILMGHRIHEDSETTAAIKDKERGREDFEMFCKFWPVWFAKFITGAYANSEKNNEF